MSRQISGRAALTLLLAGLCLIMGAQAYRQLSGSAQPTLAQAATVPEAAETPPAKTLARVTIPDLESLTDTLDRPLFRADRRPPKVAATAGEKPAQPSRQAAPQKSKAILIGTIVSPGQSRALVRLGEKQRLAWIQEGHDIDGWRVVAILPDRVTLRAGDSADQLQLARKRPVSRKPGSK